MTTQRNTKRGLAFLGIFVLGLLAGGFFAVQYGNYQAQRSAEATAQLTLEGVDFCQTLIQAMAEGDQETLFAHYQGAEGMEPELQRALRQRLAFFDGLPLSYGICQEGAVREASPTSYSAAYDLVFQADGPLPAAAQSWLPDYALEAVQATGTLTVTIQITKTEEAPWAYTLVSAGDIAI